MCRCTVRQGLNNTGKNNVVYAIAVSAVGTQVCVAGEVRQHATMLVKCSQNVFVIPNQTNRVGRAKIYGDVTYKCNIKI